MRILLRVKVGAINNYIKKTGENRDCPVQKGCMIPYLTYLLSSRSQFQTLLEQYEFSGIEK